jgi:transposase-like protein
MGSKRSSGAGPFVTLRKRLAQIEACEKSGESLKEYARRHGLSVHALYQAKKVARRQGLIPPYRVQSTARAA